MIDMMVEDYEDTIRTRSTDTTLPGFQLLLRNYREALTTVYETIQRQVAESPYLQSLIKQNTLLSFTRFQLNLLAFKSLQETLSSADVHAIIEGVYHDWLGKNSEKNQET